ERRLNDILDDLFDMSQDVVNALAIADHDDAAGGIAQAVEVHGAATNIRPQLNESHAPHKNRSPVDLRAQRHGLEVGRISDIAPAAHHVFPPRKLQHAAAHLLITAANLFDDLVDRDFVGLQLVGVDRHLVLLDEAADGGDFSDARYGADLILTLPILQRAQL